VAIVLAKAGLASAQPLVSVSLRRHVVTVKPTLALGDVADVTSRSRGLAAAMRKVPLGNAPKPSVVRTVSRALIVMRLREVGVAAEDVRFTGAPACQVRLDAVTVTAGQIAQAAVEWLKSGPWHAEGQSVVEVPRMPRDCEVPNGHVALVVKDKQRPRLPGNVTVFVQVFADRRLWHTVPVQLHVRSFERVVVAAKPVRRFEPLTSHCVRLERREITSRMKTYLRDMTQINGRCAARPLAQGEILTEDACVLIPCIKRGETVAMVVDTDRMQIRAEGIACSDGRAGESIELMNAGSRKKVRGRVVAAGLVRIAF